MIKLLENLTSLVVWLIQCHGLSPSMTESINHLFWMSQKLIKTWTFCRTFRELWACSE